MDDGMTALSIPILPLPHALDLPLPRYATDGSAGLDLLAAIGETRTLAPLERALVPCGFSLALPPGWEAQVRPRSGLALKQGLTLLNAPGTIDSDYRGEVGALLINLGGAPVAIERGMRIAQLVVAPVARVSWEPRQALSESGRGAGGFGSTGLGAAGEA